MSEPQDKFEGLVARPAMAVRGRYYYGLSCIACHHKIGVLPDASQGGDPVKIVGFVSMQITCPSCGGVSIYSIKDLKPFRKA